MLLLTIPAAELFDDRTQEFIKTPEYKLQMEHSLVSLSKWESKWGKPFLSKEPKTAAETIDYIKGLEEEKYDNMSDGWQESERGVAMSENIDSLDTCYSGLDDAVEAINEILER